MVLWFRWRRKYYFRMMQGRKSAANSWGLSDTFQSPQFLLWRSLVHGCSHPPFLRYGFFLCPSTRPRQPTADKALCCGKPLLAMPKICSSIPLVFESFIGGRETHSERGFQLSAFPLFSLSVFQWPFHCLTLSLMGLLLQKGGGLRAVSETPA